MSGRKQQTGFTLIELILVIVLIGVLAAFALPKFADLGSSAKAATVESIGGTMRSTVAVVKSRAYASGLSVSETNPGGGQSAYIVEIENVTSEVDWRNLCPESEAELGDAVTMFYFLSMEENDVSTAEAGSLMTYTNNRYTRVGYDLDSDGISTCFVEYDSFGDPDCTVTVTTTGC